VGWTLSAETGSQTPRAVNASHGFFGVEGGTAGTVAGWVAVAGLVLIVIIGLWRRRNGG
jgi:hypothetical protein